MKNQTKTTLSAAAVLFIMLALSVSAFADSQTSGFLKEWGKTLRANTTGIPDKDVYALGRNTVLTKKDIEQATQFYTLSGMDPQKAKETAVEYVAQREALYHTAIENGYAVTDEEVWDYLEELKATIQNADNREDALAVIDQFDTEEDYWNYEFTVYQKNLPIQNYVKDLEQNFMQSSTYSNAPADQTEEAWQEYFNQLKDSYVLEEDYEVVSK